MGSDVETWSVEAQLELMRRQYFQLQDPGSIWIPAPAVLRNIEVQDQIFRLLFSKDVKLPNTPLRYQHRVLKKLMGHIEKSIEDPDQDDISDSLVDHLANVMALPLPSEMVAAQERTYVTYSLPSSFLVVGAKAEAGGEPVSHTKQVTLLESRQLLASSGTTGLRTWEAALYLGSYLDLEGRTYVGGKSVLELGAGTGLVSILCKKHLGAQFVLATDGSSDVVEDIKINIFANGLEGTRSIDVMPLKWGHSLGDDFTESMEDRPPVSLILGADVTYDTSSILPLVITIQKLMDKFPGSQALIAATIRNRATVEEFMSKLGERGLASCRLRSSATDPPKTQLGFFHSLDVEIEIFHISGISPAG